MSPAELAAALRLIAAQAQPHFSLPGQPARVAIVVEPWRIGQILAAAELLHPQSDTEGQEGL